MSADGNLEINWPEAASKVSANIDVVLATATKPATVPPGANSVADAWLGQNDGFERYFLENVRHGIRTSDDVEIWRRLEDRKPDWLKSDNYARAIEVLRAEAADHQ